MRAFRILRAKAGNASDPNPIYIRDNFRPVQPVAGRKVIYYVAYSTGVSIAASVSLVFSVLLMAKRL